jgi:GNAT superfamily N-acetyltransferase
MPARSADDVRIETYGGPRGELRALFELAEDSAAELDSYIDAGRVLAATSDGEIIGHLQLTGTGDPRQVEIKNMAVRETRQGQGIGRRLIQAAVDLAAAEAVTTILVATAAADIGNLRFYQRQGFRMRSVERDAFTPATGYPPGLLIDGIELRDRVWLDREVLVRVHLAGYAGHERGRERLQVQGRVVAGPVAYRDHTRRYELEAAEETLNRRLSIMPPRRQCRR